MLLKNSIPKQESPRNEIGCSLFAIASPNPLVIDYKRKKNKLLNVVEHLVEQASRLLRVRGGQYVPPHKM